MRIVCICVPVQMALPEDAHVQNAVDEGQHVLRTRLFKREQIQHALCNLAQVTHVQLQVAR